MKYRLLNRLGLVVLGLVAFGVSRVDAQTVAPGPYYATPSWDQTLTCTASATCPRFIVLSNFSSEAVLDRETGLVWERSPSFAAETWQNAQLLCNTRVIGNRLGWRLPTLQELASLADPAQSSPRLPAGHPFSNVHFLYYWSATTSASDAGRAWFVDLSISDDVATLPKTNNQAVWCARGGQGVDPQ